MLLTMLLTSCGQCLQLILQLMHIFNYPHKHSKLHTLTHSKRKTKYYARVCVSLLPPLISRVRFVSQFPRHKIPSPFYASTQKPIHASGIHSTLHSTLQHSCMHIHSTPNTPACSFMVYACSCSFMLFHGVCSLVLHTLPLGPWMYNHTCNIPAP